MPTALSVLFLVKDEAESLPAALESVAWADEVIVVDTGSTDGTPEIAASRGARVVSIPWEGWVVSRNRALAEPKHDWVLCLDADERVTPALAAEIRAALASPPEPVSAFTMPRLSTFLGTTVRHGTWYPDLKLRLARRSRGFRVEGGRVHERFVVDGPVARLRGVLLHDTYRDLTEALGKTVLYARLAAEDRYDRGVRAGAFALLLRPYLEFLRCYFWKLGFLDGFAGVGVALVHALGYALRAGFLIERQRLARAMPAKSAPRPAPTAQAAPSAAEET